MSLEKLLNTLLLASRELPQLRFAWGLLGIALVAAIITQLLGQTQASLITLGLVFVGVTL